MSSLNEGEIQSMRASEHPSRLVRTSRMISGLKLEFFSFRTAQQCSHHTEDTTGSLQGIRRRCFSDAAPPRLPALRLPPPPPAQKVV